MQTQAKIDTSTPEYALSQFLDCDIEDITESYDNHYDTPGGEYLVLDDDQANEAVTEYIKESLWAFNADFLAGETGIPADMFTAAQDKCEGANDAFLQIVEQSCGLDEFVDDAVSADGRGHFMSHYDGEENEQGDYFIYRTN